jgi:8-oxo-dGTP pyrophosphatase MutT (NUDIX family)
MAHLNYYLDLCAEAFVVHNGTVLLRLHEKYNIWTGPGGHIDPGEDPNEAVLREVWEEVGLTVELIGPAGWQKTDTLTNTDLVPPMFLNRHRINEVHSHSAFIFAAVSNSCEVNPQAEADKGVLCIWVDQTQLDEMFLNDPRLRPETHRYASLALALATHYT